MHTSGVSAVLDRVVRRRRLLGHGYYLAWQEGRLDPGDLAEYAAQYRHFERCLPAVLSAVAGRIGGAAPRRLVEDNLHDELTNPRPHSEMFESFANAVGAPAGAPATPATEGLVSVYRDAVSEGPAAALAVIAAYEVQAAEISATKSQSLTEHYGLGGSAVEFWDVHAAIEGNHSQWTATALDLLDAPAHEVEPWAEKSARAWWSFLDERERVRVHSAA